MPYKDKQAKREADARCDERTGRKRITINLDRATAALWEQARERHGGALDTMRALLGVGR